MWHSLSLYLSLSVCARAGDKGDWIPRFHFVLIVVCTITQVHHSKTQCSWVTSSLFKKTNRLQITPKVDEKNLNVSYTIGTEIIAASGAWGHIKSVMFQIHIRASSFWINSSHGKNKGKELINSALLAALNGEQLVRQPVYTLCLNHTRL